MPPPAESNQRCHVVAAPYPGRGHINPMMNLCKMLVESQPQLMVTFLITEEWLELIGSEEKPENIRFATIPNVVQSERERVKDMAAFILATQNNMGKPFEELLDRMEDKVVSLIIADTSVINWAVEIGERRNIPVAGMWPMPASVFAMLYHFDLFTRNGHHPFDVSERGEERVNYIPGIDSIRLMDIPAVAYKKDPTFLRLVLNLFRYVAKVRCLLVSSVYELESRVIDALKQECAFPIYTFGPAIPYLNLDGAAALPTSQN